MYPTQSWFLTLLSSAIYRRWLNALLFWCLYVPILNRLGQKGGQQFFNWHLPQSSTDSPWVGVGYHHTSQQGDGNSVGRLYVVDTMKHAEKPREKQPYSTGTCIAWSCCDYYVYFRDKSKNVGNNECDLDDGLWGENKQCSLVNISRFQSIHVSINQSHMPH